MGWVIATLNSFACYSHQVAIIIKVIDSEMKRKMEQYKKDGKHY